MIPIGDSVRSRSFPYVNVAIIAVNVLIFLYELTLSTVPLRQFGLSRKKSNPRRRAAAA